jgi:hypothetical protein
MGRLRTDRVFKIPLLFYDHVSLSITTLSFFFGCEFIQIHPRVMMRSERNDAKPGEMAVMPAQAFGGFECSAVRLE